MCVWARLNETSESMSISFANKFKLCKFLAVPILLYGCETRTPLTDTERTIRAFEMKCLRRLLHFSYRKPESNDFVCSLVTVLMGPQERLLATVKRRRLVWLAHVVRHDTLVRTLLQGWMEERSRRGEQK